MADELELLRHANPVPSDDPRFHDRPLDRPAEARLDALTRAGRPRPDRPRRAPTLGRLLDGLRPRRPRRSRHWAFGLGAAAAVGAVVLTLTLSGPTTVPAVAAPRPLVVAPGSAALPLDRLAGLAAASDDVLRLRQGTHVQSWSLSMTSGPGARPPVTLPEERVVRWAADGSHTELVVATDPRHPGRPVVTDADPVPRTVQDGHVLSRRTYPPSWSDAPPRAEPPHDAARLRAYLDEIDRINPMGTDELLDAVAELLDNWTLGSRETTALARVLADAPGLRPVGAVTDRLGRPGQAYVYDDTARSVRRMLILDQTTGAVLGLEDTVTRADPEYGVEAGAVMSYRAWLR
ncbi:CU044_5270 family protein [Streptomyces sp. NPDC002685]|uniref:CU044_5270 family protein n=1 Tax=Streptomyces sp. NPDC002685 TaxID=3154540 RepID=UPI0033200FD8